MQKYNVGDPFKPAVVDVGSFPKTHIENQYITVAKLSQNGWKYNTLWQIRSTDSYQSDSAKLGELIWTPSGVTQWSGLTLNRNIPRNMQFTRDVEDPHNFQTFVVMKFTAQCWNRICRRQCHQATKTEI